MTTSELIEALKENDPSGQLEVYARFWNYNGQRYEIVEPNPTRDHIWAYDKRKEEKGIITL